MFKPLQPDDSALVSITIGTRQCTVPAGISVAAAMLLSGERAVRATPVTGTARGPYCFMGACFDCLVEIDGVPNRQGCLVLVRDGMQIVKPRGARVVEP
jgi:hypothetical protein